MTQAIESDLLRGSLLEANARAAGKQVAFVDSVCGNHNSGAIGQDAYYDRVIRGAAKDDVNRMNRRADGRLHLLIAPALALRAFGIALLLPPGALGSCRCKADQHYQAYEP